MLRIGTLALTVLAACGVSLYIGTTDSHVPYESLVELRATYMPDAVRAVFRTALELIAQEDAMGRAAKTLHSMAPFPTYGAPYAQTK